jgi:hypothetical protein
MTGAGFASEYLELMVITFEGDENPDTILQLPVGRGP